MKKTVLTIGTIAMVTLGSTFMIDSAHAEKSLDDVKTERQELKSKLSDAESDIADVLYDIKDLNEDLVSLEDVLKKNQAQLDNTEEKIDEYEEDIDVINERIEERNEILKNRIAAYQQNGGNVKFMDVLLGSSDFSELISRSEAASKIASADTELMEEQQKDMDLVEEKLDEQEEAKDLLKEIESSTKEQVEEQKKSKKLLKEKESKLKEEKSSLESKDDNLASLEKEIRSEISMTKTTEPGTSSDEKQSTNSGGEFVWPTDGGYISSPMGTRWGRSHNGIDIARTDRSTSPPIYAVKSGTIETAGPSSSFGNLVVINHGNGLKTKYAHLSSIGVSSGQKVSKGQKLGVMGETGNAQGIHLHFEVHVNGAIENPTKYLK